jgi:hypothetical protein
MGWLIMVALVQKNKIFHFLFGESNKCFIFVHVLTAYPLLDRNLIRVKHRKFDSF